MDKGTKIDWWQVGYTVRCSSGILTWWRFLRKVASERARLPWSALFSIYCALVVCVRESPIQRCIKIAHNSNIVRIRALMIQGVRIAPAKYHTGKQEDGGTD